MKGAPVNGSEEAEPGGAVAVAVVTCSTEHPVATPLLSASPEYTADQCHVPAGSAVGPPVVL